MTVRFLGDLQVIQHPAGIAMRPGSQQPARRFHQVARPGQVIAAQVIISLGKTPRDGETGDQRTREPF